MGERHSRVREVWRKYNPGIWRYGGKTFQG